MPMKGILCCPVVSALLEHSCTCGKAFPSGLWLKVFTKQDIRRFRWSFGAISDSDIKSHLHELKSKEAKSPVSRVHVGWAMLCTLFPPALDTILHFLLVLLRYLGDVPGIPYQLVVTKVSLVPLSIRLGARIVNKKLLCPWQYHGP